MSHLVYFCFMATVASLSSPVFSDKPMYEEAASLLGLTLYEGSTDWGSIALSHIWDGQHGNYSIVI